MKIFSTSNFSELTFPFFYNFSISFLLHEPELLIILVLQAEGIFLDYFLTGLQKYFQEQVPFLEYLRFYLFLFNIFSELLTSVCSNSVSEKAKYFAIFINTSIFGFDVFAS